MWKKLKRMSAMLLAAFLVITSVEYSGLVTHAAGATTVDEGGMTIVDGPTMTTSWEEGLKFEFASQYNEVKINLPEAIPTAKFLSATFDISGVTAEGASVALKLYNGDTQVGVAYGKKDAYGYTVAKAEWSAWKADQTEINRIGIMADQNSAAGSGVFKGVSFTVEGAGSEQTSFKFGQTLKDGGYKSDGATYETGADGALKVYLPASWKQLNLGYNLVQGYSGITPLISECVSVAIDVKSTDAAFTLGVQEKGANTEFFTSASITGAGVTVFNFADMPDAATYAEQGLLGFVLKSTSAEVNAEINSVTLTLADGTVAQLVMPEKAVTIYQDQANAGATSVNGGVVTTTLPASYKNIFFNMPSGITVADYDKMIVNVTGAASVGIVTADAQYGDSVVAATVDGSAYTFDLSADPVFNYLRVGSAADEASVTISGVTLEKTTVSEETKSFYEFNAAVLGDGAGDGGEGGEGGDSGSSNDNEVTTTFAGWSEVATSGSITVNIDETSGAATISSTATYTQMFYTFPDSVDTTRLEKVVLNNVTGDADKIFLRLLSEEQFTNDKWGPQIAAAYGNAEVSSDGATEPKYLVIGATAADATYSVENITFIMGETSVGGDEGGEGGDSGSSNDNEVTTTFTGWSEVSTSGSITTVIDETSGAATFSSTGTYTQMFYTFPDSVDTTRLEKVVLNNVTGDADKTFLRLLSEEQFTNDKWGAQIAAAYGNTEVASDGATEPKYLVIGVTAADASITVESITFIMGETSIGGGDEGGDEGGEGGEGGGSQTPDDGIANNIIASWNPNFESANWWNDASWKNIDASGSTNVSVAYADDAPGAACGSKYVKVTGNMLRVLSGDLVSILVEGNEYEYSYYIKLDTGSTGNAGLSIYSQTSSYGNDTYVTLNNDANYTLSEEWTKVTGKFTMVDSQDQIGLKFSGDEGTIFCVDDFRIGLVKDNSVPDEGGEELTGPSKTYTFAELTGAQSWGNTKDVDDAGKLTITFTGNYTQHYYNIPAEIDMTKVKTVTFDNFSGTNYELRLLDENAGSNYTPVASVKSGSAIDVGTATTANRVGIACVSASEAAPVTMTADSITFWFYPEGEVAPTTSVLAYHFADIPVTDSWNGKCTVDELNRAVLDIQNGYGHVTFGVPTEIRGMVITNVKVFFESGDSSVIAASLYDDIAANPNQGNGFENAWNGGIADHTLQNPGNVLQKFALKNGGPEPVTLRIRKVEFTVKGTVEGGSDFTTEVDYHFNDMTCDSTNYATASVISSGRLTLNFDQKDSEAIFNLPAEFENAKLKNITISPSLGTVSNLAIKLYDADGNQLQMVQNTASFAVDAAAAKAVKIGFMHTADGAKDITIDKINFIVDGDVDGGSTFEKVADVIIPIAAVEPQVGAGATVEAAEATGEVTVNFSAQNASVVFPIPAGVAMTEVKYIDLGAVVSELNLLAGGLGTPLNGVQIQGFTAEGLTSNTPAVTSNTSILVTDGQPITHIGMVSTAPTAGIKFSTLTFVKKNLNQSGTYVSYTADKFIVDESSTATSVLKDDKLEITFNEAEEKVMLKFAEPITFYYISDFTFTMSNQETKLDYAFYDKDKNLLWQSLNPAKEQVYTKYVRDDILASPAWGSAAYMSITTAASNPNGATCTFDGISVNRRETPAPDAPYVVPEYTILEFTPEQLKLDTSSAEVTKSETGIRGEYKSQYSEIKVKLPYTIDLSYCESISVTMKGQNVPLGIKLYKGSDMKFVEYYNSFRTEYSFKPLLQEKINRVGLMSLSVPNPEGAYAELEKITFTMQEGFEIPDLMADGIVLDPAFQDEELGNWREAVWGSGVTMSQVISPTPIYDNVTTYGQISKRTSPYECFSQDITGRVEQNKIYTFSFWAKLSEDYVGAPDNQRVVQFSPYTVDDAGVANYNPQLDGTYLQTLTPGVWTYYEGTWKVTHDNPISSAYIRIIEQGTNYGQGDCVKGSFAVTGVKMEEYVPEPPSIDEDVPDLKDALTEAFGDDFIAGTAIAGNEFDDLGVQMLANKHFNAITLGNELKPDYMFGYSNNEHTALQTIDFNGQKLVVPTIRFAPTDAKLRIIKEWNASHPDEQIKVRGHVLVWHSQTPEWFFRENYVVGKNADGTENYVSPEEMNLRLEWYIKSILEHYVGEDSEFKDMFYGWDVVNEAVGDGTGTYRTDKVTSREAADAPTHGSNSSWWAVYQSNEFIIKAFQYANKYAPAELELYYNDYNECDTKKVQGIVKLLSDVLAAEGTRIDAMGMQAHYNLNNPGMGAFERAIRSYAAVVGKVQLTELDLKASDYIGSEDNLLREYKKQGEHYKKMFEMLKKLDAEEGIEIGGVTFWGTTDKYSWLQSSSNVGGGADGTMMHCPLLFDGDYKVKPAFWAWVDYAQVDPDFVVIDSVTGKPLNSTESEKADEATEGSSESASSDSKSDASESSDATETLTVTEPEEDGGFNVVPLIVVIAAVVIAGAAAGAVVLKKKKLPKE